MRELAVWTDRHFCAARHFTILFLDYLVVWGIGDRRDEGRPHCPPPLGQLFVIFIPVSGTECIGGASFVTRRRRLVEWYAKLQILGHGLPSPLSVSAPLQTTDVISVPSAVNGEVPAFEEVSPGI